jgi:hypothetical protein
MKIRHSALLKKENIKNETLFSGNELRRFELGNVCLLRSIICY